MKGFASTRGKLLTAVAATVAVAAPAGLTSLTPAASASGGSITGAGSTLISPLMAAWTSAFQAKTGNTVSYSSVGSGAGITDITSKSVNFGASDAPLTPAERSACSGCEIIPWALTGIGVGYNVPSAHGKLKLNSSVIAKIFLGQIKNWNDPAIKKLNKGLKLPNMPITTVHRSDGSGDTYAFSNYLFHVSSTWAKRVGPPATSVSWPNGVGENGNGGITQELKATRGSIGYVTAAFLIQNKIPAAAVQNLAGKFEFPNLPNIAAAAKGVKKIPQSGVSIVDPPKKKKNAYPISTFTYSIVHQTGNGGAAGLLKQFVTYAIGPGQAFASNLDFVTLPKSIAAEDKSLIAKIGS